MAQLNDKEKKVADLLAVRENARREICVINEEKSKAKAAIDAQYVDQLSVLYATVASVDKKLEGKESID